VVASCPEGQVSGKVTGKLKERGGPARPGFAFFFGDALDVYYVGAGLRQDVVQIVPDADEGESFVEKFADACRAEKKKTEDDIVLFAALTSACVAALSSGEVYMCGNSYFS